MDILLTLKYILSESSQSKVSTGTVPKLNDTGCENYTGWNIKIISILVNLNTHTCSLIITIESRERHHFLKEHYWGLPNQDKVHSPYFWVQQYRVIEKLVEFNGLKCLFGQILRFFFLYD